MSTTLLTVPDSEVTIKWRQPYVSEALNRKLSVVPRGVIRGFIAQGTLLNDEISLSVDPATGDSVVNGSGPVSGGAGEFFVTWRVTTARTLTIPVDGALHFIYFVPGYTSGAATTPTVVDYTEAEYEAGTPQAAGGILLTVVKANGAGPAPLDSDRILTGGMTNNTHAPFVRETAAATAGGTHAQGGEEEALAVFCGFDSTTDRGLIEASAGGLSRALGSSIAFDTTTFETGTAALKFVKGASETNAAGPSRAYVTKSIPLFRDTTSGRPKKIRVAMRFQVDATFNLAAGPTTAVTGALVEFKAQDGTTAVAGSTLTSATYPLHAPLTGAAVDNNTKSTSWSWIVYELEVPDVIGASPVISAQVQIAFGEQVVPNSTMWVDRLIVTVSRQSTATQSVIDRAGLPQLATTGNAGNQTQQLVLSYGPSSGVGTNYILKKTGANDELLIVPDRADADNEIIVGEDALAAAAFPSDPVAGATNARYATLTVLGDGSGSNFGLRTIDAPLRVTGTGGNAEVSGYLTATGQVTAGGGVVTSTVQATTITGTDLTLNDPTSVALVDGGASAAVRSANFELTGTAGAPESSTVQFTDAAGAVQTRIVQRDVSFSHFFIREGDFTDLVATEDNFLRAPSGVTNVRGAVSLNDYFAAAGFSTAQAIFPEIFGIQVFGVTDDTGAMPASHRQIDIDVQSYNPIATGASALTSLFTASLDLSDMTVTGTGLNAACSHYFLGVPTISLNADANISLNIDINGGSGNPGFGLRFFRLFMRARCIAA